MAPITTPLTRQLGIQHPESSETLTSHAQNGITDPECCSPPRRYGDDINGVPSRSGLDAGGLGVIGGVGYTASQLRNMIADLKSQLRDPSLPFGVDLLIPQVGGSARKTNYDYTKGSLDELVDVIIEGGAKLFVSAVGVPPKRVVDRLHGKGVLYMNMVGHPKHVRKACEVGADIICAQGGEAGGHTGDIPFSVLVPACADLCKRYTSLLTGKPVALVAAGGVTTGGAWRQRSCSAPRPSGSVRGSSQHARAARPNTRRKPSSTLASTTSSAAWCGTGRPLRANKTAYIADWEANRQAEIKDLTARGIMPVEHELDRLHAEGKLTDEIMEQAELRPMGLVAGLVNTPDQTAKEIVDEIVAKASELLGSAGNYVNTNSRL
ncbi:hypothetical protein CIB48_g1463 [Xylaria polymorpha]|nr:hypothetical protein CIB48_g1463 [Xylaria polymorpha]